MYDKVSVNSFIFTFLGFCSLYFCPEFDLAKAEYEKSQQSGPVIFRF